MTKDIHNQTVAEFITQQIRISGKSQVEIARELGYEKPNIITMFKQGKTRIPLEKVGPLANALNIDPLQLLIKVMGEYMPDTLAALQSVLAGLQLTKNEYELLNSYRQFAKGRDVSAVVCDKTVLAVVLAD